MSTSDVQSVPVVESPTNNEVQAVSRKRRAKPGAKVAREIKRYQASAELLSARAQVDRLVRSIAEELKSDVRFRSDAITALQEAAESFIVEVFQDANHLAQSNKRHTLMQKDIASVLKLRKFGVRKTPSPKDAESEPSCGCEPTPSDSTEISQ